MEKLKMPYFEELKKREEKEAREGSRAACYIAGCTILGGLLALYNHVEMPYDTIKHEMERFGACLDEIVGGIMIGIGLYVGDRIVRRIFMKKGK